MKKKKAPRIVCARGMWAVVDQDHTRVVDCARTRAEGVNRLHAKGHALRHENVTLYLLSPADLKIWHQTKTHKGFWKFAARQTRQVAR